MEDVVGAFPDILQSLSNNSVLYCPDFQKPFILQTVVSEMVDPSAGSTSVSTSCGFHQPQAVPKRDLLLYGGERGPENQVGHGLFQYYLMGRELTLQTDHKALQWLLGMGDTNFCATQWYLIMQPFHFTVQHSTSMADLMWQQTTSPAIPARLLKGKSMQWLHWQPHTEYRLMVVTFIHYI